MQFVIGGIQKTSLLDYPDKISAIVFTQGCNFNCGYCHNPELLNFKSKNDISVDVFFDFLDKRKGKLDGVVITGGEATLQKDLKFFIQTVKNKGFLVKLDTNGTNPHILNELINENLVDYIAMDIKTSLRNYKNITKKDVDTPLIKSSIDLIMNSDIDYEFRTTVLPNLISISDFEEIGKIISGAKKYYLQKFIVQSKINDETLSSVQNYTDEEFNKIISIMKQYVQFVGLR